MPRFAELQKNKTLNHPRLPQDETVPPTPTAAEDFTFVVTADTQFGMTNNNVSWEEEIQYSRAAVRQINALEPRPLFCCVCGDLVHMVAEIYTKKKGMSAPMTRQACDEIQDRQNKDFKEVWSEIHDDIPLVCVCGNHDVGNRPTPISITRFRQVYGDDHLAFWAQRAYNIVLNTSLFSDPSGAPEFFQEQFDWMTERLQYAKSQQASHIFVFGHHPWFLYNEGEDEDTLPGRSPLEDLGMEGSIEDYYFVVPLDIRKKVLALFEEYGVTACFAGHFHQNMVSHTKSGMSMITTSSLSVILKSTGIPETFKEPKTRGMRIVTAAKDGSFEHKFVSLC